MSSDLKIDGLADEVTKGSQGSLPPVEAWNPPLSGDIDIVIDRSGHWFHEGDAFTRESLVKLFASILKKEGDEYFLVSPVEKFKIKVQDLPFVVTSVEELQEGGVRKLKLETNLGDTVIANSQHPIEVVYVDGQEEPAPQVRIRRNLYARIHRNVFYQLVELADERSAEGQQQLVVKSDGEEFVLGTY
ncbi:MAG: DUF1285 domain-containing protein [Pseudomonadales bacterium]|nr:DUF1285 domain-containing protein [Pseudomonadales bacterium]